MVPKIQTDRGLLDVEDVTTDELLDERARIDVTRPGGPEYLAAIDIYIQISREYSRRLEADLEVSPDA